MNTLENPCAYSDDEIRMLYREAAYKKKQIGILCEITLLPRHTIIEILKGQVQERTADDMKMHLWNKGYSIVKIAETLGVSVSSVTRWKKKNGLKSKVKLLSDDDYMALYERGFSDKDIALMLGVSHVTVWKFRQRNNLSVNFRKKR